MAIADFRQKGKGHPDFSERPSVLCPRRPQSTLSEVEWAPTHFLVQYNRPSLDYLTLGDARMLEPVLQEWTVDLTDLFLGSSRDALRRSERSSPKEKDESLGIYLSRERQAVVECAIASFLAVEAKVNRLFSDAIKGAHSSPFDRWLKARWHFGLRTEEKIALVLHQYAKTDFLNFPALRELFLEMASFRNALVHTAPQDYEMLLQPADATSSALIAVAERSPQKNKYPRTKFSSGLLSLQQSDAAKCHELMVLILVFLEARFRRPFSMVIDPPEEGRGYKVTSLDKYLAELPVRYFDNIDIATFGTP